MSKRESLFQSLKRPDWHLKRQLRYRTWLLASDWETPLIPLVTGNTLLSTVKMLDQFRNVAVGELLKQARIPASDCLFPTLSVEAYCDGQEEN